MQIGDHNVQINQYPGRVTTEVHQHFHAAAPVSLVRVVRSAYREQVRRIAPPVLLGRDAELAELAAFCVDGERGPYAWWRAGPWAGKSALLSTFVLHAGEGRAGRIWVVSFFITARLAGQDTREAFTTVVLEQLAALIGQDLPATMSEATREAHLHDLLARAAAGCHAAGGRLVLIVDGLDEDRGVTLGPDAHSIAALLPANPPAGMRIIVSGRPNPPVPDDVPDWHPLRDPGIIRLLDDSPHARDLQRLGQVEIKRLLKGTRVEQDLLGFLAAARGGLSSGDLCELTGAGLVHIEDVLHTVAGRTLTRRLAQWNPTTGRDVYLLGHEELQAAAISYIGVRIVGYQQRLHSWADGYRTPPGGERWPPTTPEYLLNGYPRLLAELGDLPRLVTLVTDTTRQDRLLDITGADTAALIDIATAFSVLIAQPPPDLLAALRLSWHRNRLADRNANIPTNLPAVWVTLGQPDRAEALAQSITSRDARVKALTGLVTAAASVGDHGRANALAAQAEQIARSITSPSSRANALIDLAGAVSASDHSLARVLAAQAESAARSITDLDQRERALIDLAAVVTASGDYDASEQIADAIGTSQEQARVLSDLAIAVAATGDHARAERIARSFTEPHCLARALTALVAAAAAAGRHDKAGALATEAELIVRSLIWYSRGRALFELATALDVAGDHNRAQGMASEAERIARSGADSLFGPATLTNLATAATAAGDHDRARRLALQAEQNTLSPTRDPGQQARALTSLIAVFSAAGDRDKAMALASRAEQLAGSIIDADKRSRALHGLATAVTAAGDHERAAEIARSLADQEAQAQALTDLATAIAAAGDLDRAKALAIEAEQNVRSIAGEKDRKVHVSTEVATALAVIGDHDRAEEIARSLAGSYWRAAALTDVAKAVATSGDIKRAEKIARAIAGSSPRAEALTAVVIAAGDHDRARKIARSIADSYWRSLALTGLATAAAAAGRHAEAQASAIRSGKMARSIVDPYRQPHALIGVATAFAAAGNHKRAEALIAQVRIVASPDEYARALIGLVGAATAAGDHPKAKALAARAEQVIQDIAEPYWRAKALVELVAAVTAAGDHERATALAAQAEQTARSDSDPWSQAAALANLADVVEPDRARRLIAEALAVGRWTTPLEQIARIDPATIRTFLDQFVTSPSVRW
ncbi:hypothetical protein [Dactylosporangium sp. NPDC006015]|uniref:tetratricopeptide repeat protein n=1 Tax=Dactylosporangium sp. NPDC006015 TaxID=3154576 RepID=UPI0033B571A0